MKDLSIVVYTMKHCPYCHELKDMLTKEGIEFYDRDIHEYEEEYNVFTEITSNEFIPALLIVEGDEENHESFLYAPDRNFNDLNEAVDIVKGHRKKLGII
jgi:glutaredoxin